MSARAIFRWTKSRGNHCQAEGTTRDISIAGVYVKAAACPPVRSILQVEIILPSLPTVRKTRMKAKMKVLRVENIADERRSGFSAVGKNFSLHKFSTRGFEPIPKLENAPEEQRKLRREESRSSALRTRSISISP